MAEVKVNAVYKCTDPNVYDEMIEGFISFDLEQIEITEKTGEDSYLVHHSNITIGVGTDREIDGSALRSLIAGGYLVEQ